MPPLVAYEGVAVVAAGRAILRDVDLELPAAGITAVVGPSGAGKTTLLRLANRLDLPTSGRIRVLGEDAATLDVLALRRRLGMIFQRPVAFPGSVRDNLLVADPTLDDAGAAALLVRCALPAELLGREASTLSGGEAQRMCVARALAAEPVALLADEPTASLDAAARDEIEALALGLAARGMPIAWVSHDAAQVRRIATHVVVLVDGTVAFTGTPAELDASGVGGLPDTEPAA